MSRCRLVPLALVPLLALSGCTEPPADCLADRAAAWLAANPEPIRSRADFLERVPTELRRAVFTTFPPEVQVELWRSKLEQAIASGLLDDAQTALLVQAREVLTVDLFDGGPVPDAQLQLEAQAAELFERIPLGQIVLVLDDLTPTSAQAQLQIAVTCECNNLDDWCDWPLPKVTNCITGLCIATVTGCGWWSSKPCDGTCRGGGPT